ncbi:unnamed protein product [Rotaria magnacalcarata]|uniref:MYND-type domain-containing protein n=2 Tax=Rotaria magnacalcarata TaxID=392030 RepID=A0A816MM15_9BILA|nr:unnamed protein product [Rotaria magnacalcarata]
MMLDSANVESVEARALTIRMIQAMRPSTNRKISTGKSMLAKLSDKVRDVVFTNRNLYPCYNELPIAGHEPHLRTYYREACFDTYLPIRAWFFLGKITNAIDALNSKARHRILVRDSEGKNNISIDFWNSLAGSTMFDYGLLKQGHTVCIHFASRQNSSLGVSIDKSFKKVQVFPTSLQILLTTMSSEINEHIPLRPWAKSSDAQIIAHLLDKNRYPLHYKPLESAHCWNCKKVVGSENELKLMKCARCMIALYCGKPCQTNHWTTSHKYCCNSHSVYSSMISEIKQTLDNNAKYLFEFVSTDDEEENDPEHKQEIKAGDLQKQQYVTYDTDDAD